MSSPGALLTHGDLLPRVITPPPGPRSRELAGELRRAEAPGVNTATSPDFPPILWREALGANVLDVDGNLYVDLTAGFGAAAVGHRHPRVVSAVREQAGTLLHGMGDVYAHPTRARLATRLKARLPVEDARIYFATSGAEAVEIALKTALLFTRRPGVLAFDPAYHGLTLGALAVTSRPAFREPFAPHLSSHVARLPFGCPISRVARELGGREPGDEVGAVIVEPAVGREGVLFPPPGWLAGLAAQCRQHGALLIADEIFTGFGRTGSWFAVDGPAGEDGVRPDLICCGKALAGGLPLAVTAGRAAVMDAWKRPGEALHTSTFLAHPLSCAAALASLSVLEEEALPARARTLGERLSRRLTSWPARFPQIAETRGRGLMWGVELTSSRLAYRWALEARARGILMLAGGPEGRVAQITPPLVISAPQLDAALDILELSLATAIAAEP